jgi:F-type H+-transporting ATPase subunit c
MDLAWLAAGLGAGLVVIGGGLGIGKLAASAMEAIGRQPAALIEGLAFFGLVICILLQLKA